MAENDVSLQKKQKAYADAQRLMDRAINADDYKKAAESFEKAGDYEDAAAQMANCLAQAEKLAAQTGETIQPDDYLQRMRQSLNERTAQDRETAQAREEADRARAARSRKVKKLLLVIALPLVIIVVGGILLNNFVLKDKFAYDAAMKLMDDGKYEEAIEAFNELGTYSDSQNRMLEAVYRLADKNMTDGEYGQAAALFQTLAYNYQYGDSSNRLYDAVYQLANKQLADGDYDEAYKTFTNLSTYQDSAEKAKEAMYQGAVAKQAEDELGALKDFLTLGDYSDASQLAAGIQDSLYQKAAALLQSGEFDEAQAAFAELADYSDSADKAKEAIYQKAQQLLTGGDAEGAFAEFIKIPDYSDVDTLLSTDEALVGIAIAEYRADFTVGSTVEFGRFDQNGDTSDGSETLKWLVLAEDGNRRLLIAANCVASLPFDTAASSDWENSSLKAWLDGEFADGAFNTLQRGMLVSWEDGSQVTIMSGDELKQYLATDSKRVCGMWTPEGGSTERVQYWLRGKGYYDNYAAVVATDGKITDFGVQADTTAVGVRPAIWVELAD